LEGRLGLCVTKYSYTRINMFVFKRIADNLEAV